MAVVVLSHSTGVSAIAVDHAAAHARPAKSEGRERPRPSQFSSDDF